MVERPGALSQGPIGGGDERRVDMRFRLFDGLSNGPAAAQAGGEVGSEGIAGPGVVRRGDAFCPEFDQLRPVPVKVDGINALGAAGGDNGRMADVANELRRVVHPLRIHAGKQCCFGDIRAGQRGMGDEKLTVCVAHVGTEKRPAMAVDEHRVDHKVGQPALSGEAGQHLDDLDPTKHAGLDGDDGEIIENRVDLRLDEIEGNRGGGM